MVGGGGVMTPPAAGLTCSLSKMSLSCSKPRLFRTWLMFMSSITTDAQTKKTAGILADEIFSQPVSIEKQVLLRIWN